MKYSSKTVRNNIRRLRCACRLSQEGLSRLCGLSRYVLIRIENGRKPLYLDEVVKIADALGVSLRTLMTPHSGSMENAAGRGEGPVEPPEDEGSC